MALLNEMLHQLYYRKQIFHVHIVYYINFYSQKYKYIILRNEFSLMKTSCSTYVFYNHDNRR